MDETIPLPDEVRALFDAPNYVHLSTLRRDGTPRNWVVWAATEGDHVLVCTGMGTLKAKDMAARPAVAMSVTDFENPYRMATIQGRVVEVRPDEDCAIMDEISRTYIGRPFPMRGPGRVCFVTLGFEHEPG
jgi:PPOX class probable F420-dependent enzyme